MVLAPAERGPTGCRAVSFLGLGKYVVRKGVMKIF